ncbi:MAG TPA: RDD family protein, partial [Terriglobales bacterium]|nr:RDD family protein [Terriglobales bacterium]
MYSPDKLTIETPEQIPLEFPLAGIGSRFLAIALDTLIQVLGFLMIVFVAEILLPTAARFTPRALTWAAAIFFLCVFILYSGYYALFEVFWNGQTPGKRLVRLRVISDSGRPITVYEAVVRNLLRIIDQLPGLYVVGIISVFLTARNKRLGDIVAGTVVVHEKAMQDSQPDFFAAAASTALSSGLQITAEELELIERFLQRRYDLSPEVRRQSAEQIAGRLRARLGAAQDGAASPEDYLESLARQKRDSAGL